MFSNLNLLDRILDSFRGALGQAFGQYRNRAYRLANLALLALPDVTDDELLLLQVAAAFHGVEGVMGGLASERASAWLARHPDMGRMALSQKQATISRMLAHSDAVGSTDWVMPRLVQVFRQGVLVDNAQGFRVGGLVRVQVRAIRAAFPDQRARMVLAGQDYRQAGRMLLTLWFALARRG